MANEFSRRAAELITIEQDRMAHASEILDKIAKLRIRYAEVPVNVRYTAYSKRKGQKGSEAVKIASRFLLSKVLK